MSRRFLLLVVGFSLLLSQPCRARVSKEWLDQVIQVCGRAFVRSVIEICGRSSMTRGVWSQQRPAAEIMPYFINKDAEPLARVLAFSSNLPREQKAALSERKSSLLELQQYASSPTDSISTFKEFTNTIHTRKGEEEDIRPPGLKHLGFNARSRKKRDSHTLLSHQCCSVGCTRRSIVDKFC